MFSKSTISISYLGKSDDEVTVQLMQIAEAYLCTTAGLEKLSRKVPFLIAESFQNIIRHSESPYNKGDSEGRKNFFQIVFFADRVVLSVANLVKRKNTKALDEKINNLNTLSKEDLKLLWQKMLLV